MRKLIYTLAFLPVLALAETSPRLDSLRVATNWQSGLAATGNDRYSPTIVNWAVNRAIQRVCNDFPAVEKRDTIAADSTDYSYAANTDVIDVAFALKIWRGDSGIVPLQDTSVRYWYVTKKQAVVADPDDANVPRFIKYFGGRYTLYPPPRTRDSIEVSYFATDRLLTADTMVTAVLPAYRDGIIYYAGYIMAMATQQSFYIQVFAQAYNAMNPKVRIEIEAAK